MKWPNKINLCKDCSEKAFTPWFGYKLQEWVDMDYPYETFRPSLLVCARKDLCQECEKKLIECVDRVNGYPKQKSTDELDKAWKDCHGWGY